MSDTLLLTPVNRCPTSPHCLISQLTTSSLTSPHNEHQRLTKPKNAFNRSSITRRIILPSSHILPIISRLTPHPLHSTPHFQCPRAAPTNPPATESCDSRLKLQSANVSARKHGTFCVEIRRGEEVDVASFGE